MDRHGSCQIAWQWKSNAIFNHEQLLLRDHGDNAIYVILFRHVKMVGIGIEILGYATVLTVPLAILVNIEGYIANQFHAIQAEGFETDLLVKASVPAVHSRRM